MSIPADPSWLATLHHTGEITTWTGRVVTPLDLQLHQIHILDIAHALARINRYNGHTAGVISVAEHSVAVSHLVTSDMALCALFHDATEAYIGDMVRPLKKTPEFGRLYQEAEDQAWVAIAAKFNLPLEMPEAVIIADNVRLDQEINGGLRDDPNYGLCPEDAELRFLQRYLELTQ